jgi:hypothetical protein
MSSKTFSPQEVADLSDLKVATVLTWIRAKKLKAKNVRGYAIDGAEVRGFLLAQAAIERKAAKLTL